MAIQSQSFSFFALAPKYWPTWLMNQLPCGIMATLPLPKLAPISCDGTAKYLSTLPPIQPLSK